MIELELSIIADRASVGVELKQLLEPFETQQRVKVKVTLLSWESAWADVVKYALYHDGPDVSEIGSTWVGSSASMQALRPYHLQDVTESWVFLPTVWRGGLLHSDKTLWAMPWLAGTRLIYYHRDLFEKAGVDPQSAFQTPETMAQAFSQMPLNETLMPWAVATPYDHNTLHNMSAWVWGAGGDFIDLEREQVAFNREPALAGMEAYFSLGRFIAPQARGLTVHDVNQLFHHRQAAATLNGPWLYIDESEPRLSEDIEMAKPPGVPFVGGSNLVIWQHVAGRQERAAVELVQFLTSQEVQSAYSKAVGLLPVRMEALNDPQFIENPKYQVMADCLRQGRSFPALARWGAIEDKLMATLNDIWSDLLANPSAEVAPIINKHISAAARRLEITLKR